MNWYTHIKLAAIWDIESDMSFEGEVRKLYELEFKYQMIKNKPFKGTGNRRQNILARLEQEAWHSAALVADTLLNVMSRWLQSHAITNPEDWANARINDNMSEYDEDFTQMLNMALGEFESYQEYRPSYKKDCSEIMRVLRNADIPEAHQFLVLFRAEEEESQRENFMHEIETGTYYGDLGGMDPETYFEQNILPGIQNMTLGDYIDLWDGSDCESISEVLHNIYQYNYSFGNAIIKYIYQQAIFPKWYEKWAPQGIEQTRETVEKNYELLKTWISKDINNALAVINIAINTVHQNGSILEYIDDYGGGDLFSDYSGKEFLSEMSNLNTSEWEKELQAIGVVI